MTNKHDDMPEVIWALKEHTHPYQRRWYTDNTFGVSYTRTDTLPKQEGLDPDTLYFCTLCMTNHKGDKNCRCHNPPEPVKETQKPLHVEKTCKENAKILADKDRVMDMMAEALKTCEWIRDENGHDWPRYDEEKVSQALAEFERLKNDRM